MKPKTKAYIWIIHGDEAQTPYSFYLATHPPKPDGNPYRSKGFHAVVDLHTAIILTAGLPPKGKRVFTIEFSITELGQV